MSSRRWYQGLTHDLDGKFSVSQTVVSASIITAMAGIGFLIDKVQENNANKRYWQQAENKRKLAQITLGR